jgi:hypothetical protein
MGTRLRISVEEHPSGALVTLQRLDERSPQQAVLDHYAAEVLCGYIMSARLALPGGLPDEIVEGRFPCRLRLQRKPSVGLTISQDGSAWPFEIPATFWDRLYAEFCLVVAHSRELGRRVEARLQ